MELGLFAYMFEKTFVMLIELEKMKNYTDYAKNYDLLALVAYKYYRKLYTSNLNTSILAKYKGIVTENMRLRFRSPDSVNIFD